MRISDWSSDVCSSDLVTIGGRHVNVILCNGRRAEAADLVALAMRNHGHFTTMQVRDGAVRGLDLHLARLREATAELFDVAFDDARATGGLRQALDIAGSGDCRSEAPTSELQSIMRISSALFCLKKNTHTITS